MEHIPTLANSGWALCICPSALCLGSLRYIMPHFHYTVFPLLCSALLSSALLAFFVFALGTPNDFTSTQQPRLSECFGKEQDVWEFKITAFFCVCLPPFRPCWRPHNKSAGNLIALRHFCRVTSVAHRSRPPTSVLSLLRCGAHGRVGVLLPRQCRIFTHRGSH